NTLTIMQQQQSQQGSGNDYDPLFSIDLLNVELLEGTEQQQQPPLLPQQQQQPPHHYPDSSDSSFAVSLSPLSSCSSGFSPHSFGHHQQQQQQPMPLFLEEQGPDFLQLNADSTSPHQPPFLQQQQQRQQQTQAQACSGAFKTEPSVPDDVVGAAAAAPAVQPGKAGGQRHPRDDKICGVCGDKALGFNFDAVSCESCKAFFRRNAVKGVEAFKCPYSGACSIDVSNRRFCKRCRLAKCFDIGMKREYILTEEEKLEKRKKIDQNKLIRTLESLQLLPRT
ncbi:hypothetical protein BOX15_Mlig029344g2, partial [Macrostomum lignano]